MLPGISLHGTHLPVAVRELVACGGNLVQCEHRLAGRHIDAEFAHDLGALQALHL